MSIKPVLAGIGAIALISVAACGSAPAATGAPAATPTSAASILAADGYSPTANQVSVPISSSWSAYPYITDTAAGTNGSNAEEVITFSSQGAINSIGGDSALVQDADWSGLTATANGTVMKIDGPVTAFQNQ
jgi:hypothetical protein